MGRLPEITCCSAGTVERFIMYGLSSCWNFSFPNYPLSHVWFRIFASITTILPHVIELIVIVRNWYVDGLLEASILQRKRSVGIKQKGSATK